MPRPHPDHEKLFHVAALCQTAIQAQRDRERRAGFGVDDYTEGRIVGAANLARSILRALISDQAERPERRSPPRPTSRPRSGLAG